VVDSLVKTSVNFTILAFRVVRLVNHDISNYILYFVNYSSSEGNDNRLETMRVSNITKKFFRQIAKKLYVCQFILLTISASPTFYRFCIRISDGTVNGELFRNSLHVG